MTLVESIVDWVKDKPVWWRQAIRLSLRDGELTQVNLNEIYQIALMENGLLDKDESYTHAEKDVDTTGFELESHEVTLNSISNVTNVGVLAEDQQLQFQDSGLTVVFGDNGSGKSGYARIFKHACLARGRAPEILGNVFDLSDKPSTANISVEVEGVKDEKNWHLKAGADTNLKSIRVFDGDVADNFVSDEDELGYKPLGLYILEDLATAIESIKRLVVEEIMPGNGFVSLPQFANTAAGKFVSNLSSATNIEDVDKHIATEEEIIHSEELQEKVNDLKAKSPEQIKKELNNKKAQLILLQSFVIDMTDKLSDKVLDEIKEKVSDAKRKTYLANELKEKVLNDLPISGIGSKDWQLMWDSAENFLKSVGNRNFPPQEGEDCPLCLQPIGEKYAIKLKEFQEFVLDKTSQQARESQTLVSEYRSNIKNYNLNTIPYEAAISLISDSEKEFSKNFHELVGNLNKRKEIFCNDPLPEKPDKFNKSVIETINKQIEGIEKYLKELVDDKDAKEVLLKKEQELLEVSDRKLIKANAAQIKSNILRFKSLDKYNELGSKCNTRSVTKINAEICKAEVIKPVVDFFDDELKRFNFDRFKVEPKTKGRSGAQLLRLEISDSGEPLVAKVASEGEQRCIAIACFLAEMRADQRKSAVIFDDPVNSLSHRWSSRVAKRLVEESINRQVIVLTHDISFYKYLLEETERQAGSSFNGICLERSRKAAGIVRKSPPWDALTTNARIKELKTNLTELKSIDIDGTEKEFRNEAYKFYGFLRETWERLVEEKLLNQVVTRFGRSVQTSRLKRLTDLTEEDIRRVDEGMSKCSTYFRGHDSAPGVGDAYPTINEVEADLSVIDEFNKELQSKKRKRG